MDGELRFIDDKLFAYTPSSQYGAGVVYKTQLVMTKEIFQECYKRWIEPQAIKKNEEDEYIKYSYVL